MHTPAVGINKLALMQFFKRVEFVSKPRTQQSVAPYDGSRYIPLNIALKINKIVHTFFYVKVDMTYESKCIDTIIATYDK
jgi:hypothetical protein